MRKIEAVRLTLDRLPGILADLVRLDDNWQEWDFCQLVDSLRRWTERNPKTPTPTLTLSGTKIILH